MSKPAFILGGLNRDLAEKNAKKLDPQLEQRLRAWMLSLFEGTFVPRWGGQVGEESTDTPPPHQAPSPLGATTQRTVLRSRIPRSRSRRCSRTAKSCASTLRGSTPLTVLLFCGLCLFFVFLAGS